MTGNGASGPSFATALELSSVDDAGAEATSALALVLPCVDPARHAGPGHRI